MASAEATEERGEELAPAKTTLSGPGLRRCVALEPVPESVKAARDFTAASLRGWHLDPLIEDAVVIASELATNAIRHGTPACHNSYATPRAVELTWHLQVNRLICMVTDLNGTPPMLAHEDPEAESGHGLQIVDALAVSWGWTMLDTGEKAVWAALGLPEPADAALPRRPPGRLTGQAD